MGVFSEQISQHISQSGPEQRRFIKTNRLVQIPDRSQACFISLRALSLVNEVDPSISVSASTAPPTTALCGTKQIASLKAAF